jgi:hypothetical protein
MDRVDPKKSNQLEQQPLESSQLNNNSSPQISTSFSNPSHPTNTEQTSGNNFSQVPLLPQTAAVYFCFEDDKFDKPENPNKIILAKEAPTVQDLCATLKSLFYPNQDVTITCTFNYLGTRQLFSEDSEVPVPTDRNNVVMLKVKRKRFLSSVFLFSPITLVKRAIVH